MPYKLLITGKLTPPRKYKKFLSSLETVTGRRTKFAFELKNIGGETLPKGELNLKLERTGLGSYATSADLSFETPTLQPEETFTVEGGYTAVVPGAWFMTAKVELKSRKKVEYYLSEKGTPMTDKWIDSFYVISRHHLDLNLLIAKLLKRKVE